MGDLIGLGIMGILALSGILGGVAAVWATIRILRMLFIVIRYWRF